MSDFTHQKLDDASEEVYDGIIAHEEMLWYIMRNTQCGLDDNTEDLMKNETATVKMVELFNYYLNSGMVASDWPKRGHCT
jgi:hypothetical protein